ncbi:hypothetical protein K474DRAFT_1730503 [Panus rudis PR-1116 ss-1]|nr:hypothetical protein K474DRAFT_1730503 [Panus rudis PR-1116 ss-1]
MAMAIVQSDIWFDDGNVVLIAEHVAFKVHKGQLERHSEVFRDLFTIPQPRDTELIDGCPWVELHDTPSDVLYLLRALYDGMYFEKPLCSDFPFLSAVLRLSSKYLIDNLRQRCLHRLRTDWPSTLEGWDRREKEGTDENNRYVPRDVYPQPLPVIRLAISLGLDELLPAAYYDLSRYGPRRIVAGTRAPPSLLFPPAPGAQNAEGNEVPVESDMMTWSMEELQLILRGRETAQRYVIQFVETELASRGIASNCLNKHHENGRVCRESFYFIMLNVLRAVGGISHGRDADPLYTLMQTIEMVDRTDFSDGEKMCGLKICIVCKTELGHSVEMARKDVWSKVPAWFGLHTKEQEVARL